MSKELARQLELEEGRVPYVYLDTLGFQTIGVGRLVDKRKGGKLSDSEIDVLLNNDIQEKSVQVITDYPWAANLSPARLDALIQMCFQLGRTGLAGFKTFLLNMRLHNWTGAVFQLRNSRWHTQTPNRVERICKQILTDTYQYNE